MHRMQDRAFCSCCGKRLIESESVAFSGPKFDVMTGSPIKQLEIRTTTRVCPDYEIVTMAGIDVGTNGHDSKIYLSPVTHG